MSTGKDFSSDNASPAAPQILAALARANTGTAHAYGDDALSARLSERMSELFDRRAWVFPMFTGTAANAVALATMTPAYGAILCHEGAHIHVHECGATEMMTGGAKIVPLAGDAGRLSPETVRAAVNGLPRGVMHNVQPAALSVTQATEVGTLYSPQSLTALTAEAHRHGLKVHMDGARFANAVARLGVKPQAISCDAGVDILSFGGTKNGALAAEAMVVFDEALADVAIYRQKRAGQVASKMRFVSAQLLAMVEGDLWLQLAGAANATAAQLADGAVALGCAPAFPAEINQVFLPLSRAVADRLHAAGYQFYAWGAEPAEGTGLYRFVTSFLSVGADVDALLAALRIALAR